MLELQNPGLVIVESSLATTKAKPKEPDKNDLSTLEVEMDDENSDLLIDELEREIALKDSRSSSKKLSDNAKID